MKTEQMEPIILKSTTSGKLTNKFAKVGALWLTFDAYLFLPTYPLFFSSQCLPGNHHSFSEIVSGHKDGSKKKW